MNLIFDFPLTQRMTWTSQEIHLKTLSKKLKSIYQLLLKSRLPEYGTKMKKTTCPSHLMPQGEVFLGLNYVHICCSCVMKVKISGLCL